MKGRPKKYRIQLTDSECQKTESNYQKKEHIKNSPLQMSDHS